MSVVFDEDRANEYCRDNCEKVTDCDDVIEGNDIPQVYCITAIQSP